MWLMDKALRRLVKRGELSIIDHDGRAYRYGSFAADLEPVTIRFTDARISGAIFRNPELAAAEGYMEGRLVFDQGDILALVLLVTANNRWEDGVPRGPRLLNFEKARGWFKARNREARAKRNAAHHYDIGNALYRLFLDDDLQYSCAYFTDPENSLEQAQEDKKAHIASKLYLQPGNTVLDIGCGWGGTALYLNRHYDVDVLGVTLSEEQLKVARQRASAAGVSDRVRFELMDYRRVQGSFDRIVSVGMFEHVGAAHYDEFFQQARRLLAADGVMLLHTIGRFDTPSAGDPFADKYIFPGYHLPNLSQIVSASERARLIAADVETLRLHYAFTLRNWLIRTRAHRSEIIALYDERFFRMWEVYLAGAIAMFELGGACVYQLQYVRSRTAVPLTRNYLGDEEVRLRKRRTDLPS